VDHDGDGGDDDNDDGGEDREDGDDDDEDDDEDYNGDDDDEDDDNAEDRVEDAKVEDDDVEKEENDDVEEEDRSQDRETHFARDCAVKMHVHMPQETSEEALYIQIYRKIPRARLSPERGRKLHASLRSRNACPHLSQEASEGLYTESYTKYAAAQIEPRTRMNASREPAQSKHMSTCHKRHQKRHFIRKLTGKMPRPRLSPERGRTLRASLRSRNTCPHVTRGIRRGTLYGSFQEKWQGPD